MSAIPGPPDARSVSLALIVVAAGLACAAPAWADPPSPPPPEAPAEDKEDLMHVLSRLGLHDLRDESVNAYGQVSIIGDAKPSFAAKYTDLHGTGSSLSPRAEGSWTGTATLFLAGKLWHGAEVYVVPELISERPLSNLKGLGSTIQNAELQKGGGAAPTLYMSRVYLRQTFGFGGERVEKKSDAMQLGSVVESRRLVLTVGKFSVLDFLDKNSYAGDLRRQFMNMAFLTHASYDFAADARGYTWGGVAELYLDDWVVRLSRLAVPENPNQLAVDARVWKYYGDQVELEHGHKLLGQAGVVRVLGYRNREDMGRFDDAVTAFRADPGKNAAACKSFHYDSTDAAAPDLCWARRDNVKLGVGINLEQHVSDDLGLFLRGMYSDGRTEVYSFTSSDRSFSFGALSKGSLWHRPNDSAGAAFGVSWISRAHATYLDLGGIDGFIGDGRLSQAPESVLEVFYSVNVVKSLWLSADFQHLTNPAYNADRGPVEIFAGRIHAEF